MGFSFRSDDDDDGDQSWRTKYGNNNNNKASGPLNAVAAASSNIVGPIRAALQ